MTTFSAVLDAQLRHEPGRPLITFYDHATGERVELSVTTYANWVAKAASLLVEEHDLELGGTLRVDLPTHWLGPVFLGAAWAAGLVVTDAEDADAVVCGPDTLALWSPTAQDRPVLACALLPMGVRFDGPLPPGVHDVGVNIWSQPDAFVAYDPPGEDSPAVTAGGVTNSQAELWNAAAAGSTFTGGGRLLSVANPASPPDVATFTEPLISGGSLILVTHADQHQLEATYAAERATVRFPA